MTYLPDLTPFAASSHDTLPSRLGQRYSQTAFLPEAGNTIICDLDSGDPAHEAVLEARTRMLALPGAVDHLLFTPVESLHMTVFQGVIETRIAEDAWPEGMDLNAPLSMVTDELAERLKTFPGPEAFTVRPVGLLPVGLQLAGATQKDEGILRSWRDALTVPFGFRHPEHNAYAFHMTFAYPIRWIPDELMPIWVEGLGDIFDDFSNKTPIIPLKAPAFCTFEDMVRFDPVVRLVVR
ncbi:MAG: DUF1868 domain-containing protein [Pseudomonadota bacterium]